VRDFLTPACTLHHLGAGASPFLAPPARARYPAPVPPADFRVLDASFRMSAPTLKLCPEHELPEIAFIGRSNVGKSSLLGVLFERPKLVKTSRTPGHTRAVNIFDLTVRRVEGETREERTFVCADLPGYGYGKMSKGERQRLSVLLSSYLGGREPLRAVCQLFDLRHSPTGEDRDVLEGLQQRDYEAVLVATKSDKLPLAKRKAARGKLAKSLGVAPELVTLFSAETRHGREQVWQRLWRATG
jgi:GTP-binding protein